jgi:outer membrane receptor protein involved in Fe transport
MKRIFLIISIFTFSIASFSQKRIAPQKTKEEILNETYCTGLFNTQHADYIDFLDETISSSAVSYFNVLDWLQGRVAGLRIYTNRNNLRIPYIRNQRAGVFVNEMRVDYDYLNLLPVNDIAMIKIMKGPFASPFGAGGAIAIYTKRGEDTEGEESE